MSVLLAAALADYGELLLDRQRYEDVLQLSQIAFEVDPYNAPSRHHAVQQPQPANR